MPTKTISPGITLFDLDDRKGFMVRICRKGKRLNECFSVVRCRSLRKARSAAEARYAELLKHYGPTPTPAKNQMTSRNSTGRVGIHIAHSVSKRWPDCESWAYCASWVDAEGKRRKINFAWEKYGKQNAWRLACIARDKESTDREAIVSTSERSKKTTPKRKLIFRSRHLVLRNVENNG